MSTNTNTTTARKAADKAHTAADRKAAKRQAAKAAEELAPIPAYVTESAAPDSTERNALNEEFHRTGEDIAAEVERINVNSEDAAEANDRLSDAERKRKNETAYRFPVDSRPMLKLAALPELVPEAPSAYDPSQIVAEHWELLLTDGNGREAVFSVYASNEVSFKRGVNRRTDGDLCSKFRTIAYTDNGKEAPEEISLVGKKYEAAVRAGKPVTGKDVGGVAAYLARYYVQFWYGFKTNPTTGEKSEYPGLSIWMPEDFGNRPMRRNWIKF